MKKIRITKKRNKAIDIALSLDDYLYEKYRRLNEELRKSHERYIRNPRRLWEVIRQTKDGHFIKEQVVKIEVCDEGSRVIIS